MSFKIPIYTGGSKKEKIAPILNSITIEDANPTNVVMVFSEAVTGTNLGFTIGGTTSTTFASISGSGTTWTGVLGTAAEFGQTITLSYASGAGDFKDLNNNDLASITNQAVTNNVADLYGSDLVTDGDMDVSGSWTQQAGWSIGGGVAACDGNSGAVSYLSQGSVFPVGTAKVFKVEFDVTGYVSGNCIPVLDGYTNTEGANADGHWVFEGTRSFGDTSILYMRNVNEFIGNIDNVTCKELL